MEEEIYAEQNYINYLLRKLNLKTLEKRKVLIASTNILVF